MKEGMLQLEKSERRMPWLPVQSQQNNPTSTVMLDNLLHICADLKILRPTLLKIPQTSKNVSNWE